MTLILRQRKKHVFTAFPTTSFKTTRHHQWWIQDFLGEFQPLRGGGGGSQRTIWPFFPENCMKMKKFWPRREEARPSPHWVRISGSISEKFINNGPPGLPPHPPPHPHCRQNEHSTGQVTYLATEKMMRRENGAANCGMMSLEAWSNWVSREFVAQW